MNELLFDLFYRHGIIFYLGIMVISLIAAGIFNRKSVILGFIGLFLFVAPFTIFLQIEVEKRLNTSKILMDTKDLQKITKVSDQTFAVDWSWSSLKSYTFQYSLHLPQMSQELDMTKEPIRGIVSFNCEEPKDCYQNDYESEDTPKLLEQLRVDISCNNSIRNCLDSIDANSAEIILLMNKAMRNRIRYFSIKLK